MTPSAIWFITYKLNEGVSDEAFLAASKACNDEVLSRQPGFLSWDILRSGDTWVDLVKWASAEDAQNAETAGAENPAAHAFYALIDMDTCKMQLYTVAQSH